MESSEDEKIHFSFVDFPFICRICLVPYELTLFESEQRLWDLFQSLMKIEVRPTDNFPKNVCRNCINKLRDISLFIEVSRYTDLYFVENVISMKVEDVNEKPNYCRSCLSTTILSPFEEKISLLQLFREITKIDVTTSTNKNSICYRCIDELEKASSFLNLSKKNNGILEKLANVDVKKEDLITDDDEGVVGRNEQKVEIDDGKAVNSNGQQTFDGYMMKTDELRHLHTTIDIKEEVHDSEHTSASGSGDTKPFACDNHEERFTTKGTLQSHLLIHTEEDSYKCDYCDERFAKGSSLRTHLLTHTREKPFKCDYCNKRFTHKAYLQSHSLIHTGEKPFKCDNCDKRFTQGSTLRTHMLIHTGEKPFKCDYCDKRFTQRACLRSHLLIHTGEKPFKCDYCDKRFTRKAYLRSHSLIHFGEEPFKCDYCDKRFTQGSTLRTHLLTHTREKPFKCDYCDKRFTQRACLRSHLLIHTGEKPFKCDYCDKRFTRKAYLRSHSLIHTGEKTFQI